MFASGPISASFTREVLKMLGLGTQKIGRAVVLNELLRIENGSYNGFGTNKTTVEIVDTDRLLTELMVFRSADESSRAVFTSIAYETCAIPLAGRLRVIEHKLDDRGRMMPGETVAATEADEIILLAKTSDSGHIYQLVAETDVCLVLMATWKCDPDDYYVVYDRHSLEFMEAVSTSSRESRVQFWLTFHGALRESLPDRLIEQMQQDAETAKLREFLSSLRREIVHA
jgi:hypothetical protein